MVTRSWAVLGGVGVNPFSLTPQLRTTAAADVSIVYRRSLKVNKFHEPVFNNRIWIINCVLPGAQSPRIDKL